MIDFVKKYLRRRSLKKARSKVESGFIPLSQVHGAVAFIDVEDTSFDQCKNEMLLFFRRHNIHGELFYFDFRKLGDGERLITSINGTVLKKDLNWFDRPSDEKINVMLDGDPELFISVLDSTDYPIEYMAKASTAKFKIGRRQLPDNVFDLVVSDANSPRSEVEVFRLIASFLEKVS